MAELFPRIKMLEQCYHVKRWYDHLRDGRNGSGVLYQRLARSKEGHGQQCQHKLLYLEHLGLATFGAYPNVDLD